MNWGFIVGVCLGAAIFQTLESTVFAVGCTIGVLVQWNLGRPAREGGKQ